MTTLYQHAIIFDDHPLGSTHHVVNHDALPLDWDVHSRILAELWWAGDLPTWIPQGSLWVSPLICSIVLLKSLSQKINAIFVVFGQTPCKIACVIISVVQSWSNAKAMQNKQIFYKKSRKFDFGTFCGHWIQFDNPLI